MLNENTFPGDWFLDVAREIAQIVEIEKVCGEVGVDWDTLRVPPERVASSVVVSVIDKAAEESGDSLLGLHLAERITPRGTLNYFAAAQATLRDALEQLSAFQHLVCSGRSLFVVERGATSHLVSFAAHSSKESRHLTEFFILCAALEVRRWVNDGVLEEVHFRHAAAGPVDEYERLLEVPARFGMAHDALVAPSSSLDAPLVGGNPQVAVGLRPLLLSLAELGEGLPFRERAEMVVRSCLLSERSDSPYLVADRLGVTATTLHRNLAAEETDYRHVVEAARRELAPRLLALSGVSAAEIAQLCGFSTIDEFVVAFESWTGRPPFSRLV